MTAGARAGRAAASEPRGGNQQRGSKPRLWLREEARRCCGQKRPDDGLQPLSKFLSPLRCRTLPFLGADGLQHPDGCRRLTLEALADVVGVGSCAVLKQHLSGLAGPGQRLQQVLHLVGGAGGGRQQHQCQSAKRIFLGE